MKQSTFSIILPPQNSRLFELALSVLILKNDTNQNTNNLISSFRLNLRLPSSGLLERDLNIDNEPVPNLERTSTDFNTDTVSKMGHLINQTLNKPNVLHPPTKNLEEKDEEGKKKIAPSRVSNLGHSERSNSQTT